MQLNYCLIGFTLMLSGFYMSFLNRDSDHFRRFYSLLDTSQKEIYENIVKERLLIYIAGTIIGTAISYYYYSTHKNDKLIICKLLVILGLYCSQPIKKINNNKKVLNFIFQFIFQCTYS